MQKNSYLKPFEYKLIYVFAIDDDAHRGKLKVGDATIHTDKQIDELIPNCRDLNQAAKARINQYTGTAGISYELLHTELAIREARDSETNEIGLKAFRDHEVHNVLTRSGKEKIQIDGTTGKEWFEISLETAQEAIKAVKDGRQNLSGEKVHGFIPIEFRPEQKKAIKMTIDQFKKSNKMLWNAKMRFGKTLSALEVIRRSGEIFENNKNATTDKFKKSIIITHRPVVDDGWYEDFDKIFGGQSDYIYGSKKKGYSVDELLKSGKNFVYFASIQDLRGSEEVGGKFPKNSDIYKTNWDLVVIDEAHEGTTTQLGEKVVNKLITDINDEFADEDTKVLALSGTPFNIFTNFEEGQIYTWDYIMEQEQKTKWALEHYGDSNPYDELPQMHIYTYDLGNLISKNFVTLDDKAFNFREFFRTWTGDVDKDGKHMPEDKKIGSFVHEEDVRHFLDLMVKEDETNNYPYSTEEYRELFQHALWMVPGVKEARALKKLMLGHPVFGSGAFDIVNVAGDGDEEEAAEDALKKVLGAIKKTQPGNYTITLSCGKLTTGVTIREWTAVFMLAGSYSTSASSYLQTIFRVQSPCNKDGKIKGHCYVFDFAPDRTLKMVAEAVSVSGKAGVTTDSDRERLGKFLNYCPVISLSGSVMKEYDVGGMFKHLKRAYTERVVMNGFDDEKLYNDELLKLDNLEIEKFNDLKRQIGSTQSVKSGDLPVNSQGLTEEEYKRLKNDPNKNKPKRELTPEEQAEQERFKEARKMKNTAISILRGISIRMPLLIYGAGTKYDEEITLDRFVDIIDEQSWAEFMPSGVTKEKFNEFKKYYEEDVFEAAAQRIRNVTKSADELEPTERVQRISELFSHFRNPDKETVLTPWRVVNMHMSDTLGGYDFFNEEHREVIEEPRFVDQGDVTDNTFKKGDAKILEINSKTGLYPLYVTYSIYRDRCGKLKKDELTAEKKQEIWNNVVKDDIYVICKTPMAKSITKRTLVGYHNVAVNAHYMDDFIGQFQNKRKQLTDRLRNPSYWGKRGLKMDFDAVVGNPPYNLNLGNTSGNSSKSKAIYNIFISQGKDLEPQFLSMITPSRWMTRSSEGISDEWVDDMLNDKRIRLMHDYTNAGEVFPGVGIRGGVNYFLWERDNPGKCDYFLHSDDQSISEKNDYLNSAKTGIVIRDAIATSVIDKIKTIAGEYYMNPTQNFSGLVSPKDFFTNKLFLTSSWDDFASEKTDEYSIKYYVNKNIHKVSFGWIKESDIPKNLSSIHLNKVFIPAAGGNGNDRQVLGKPFLGEKGSACSQTYLVIGYDPAIHNLTTEECSNIILYLQTRFARYLVSIKKKTQNGPRGVYQFVPMQDFTNNSDIKWASSIDEIDEQLYDKYSFSEQERDYIKTKIDIPGE